MIQGGTRPQTWVQLRFHVVQTQNAFRLHCCSSTGVTMGNQPPDVLLLDATNILSKAKADSSRWRGHRDGPSLKRCFQAWIDFLHTSTAGVPIIAVFDSPVGGEAKQRLKDRRHKSLTPDVMRNRDFVHRKRLQPYLKIIEDKGGFALISKLGYEADEAIGAISKSLVDQHPGLFVTIASGDSDIQNFIREQVSWLKIQNATFQFLGNTCSGIPDGLALVSQNAFLQAYNFNPRFYADYLSYVGKKELRIGGVGIGSKTATKLVQQYGSIHHAAKAATEGRLNGWDNRVKQVFTPGSLQFKRLLSNYELLRPRSDDPDSVLTALQKHELNQFSQGIPVNKVDQDVVKGGRRDLARSIEDINRLHPVIVLRWSYVCPYADMLCRFICAHGLEATVQGISHCGLPVDVLFKGTCSLFVCCPNDFITEEGCQKWLYSMSGSLSSATLAEILFGEESSPHTFDPFQMAPFLHGSTRQYIRQVRKTSCRVILLPWCIVLAGNSFKSA